VRPARLRIDARLLVDLLRDRLVELNEAEYGDYVNSAKRMLEENEVLVTGASLEHGTSELLINIVISGEASIYLTTARVEFDKQVGLS